LAPKQTRILSDLTPRRKRTALDSLFTPCRENVGLIFLIPSSLPFISNTKLLSKENNGFPKQLNDRNSRDKAD